MSLAEVDVVAAARPSDMEERMEEYQAWWPEKGFGMAESSMWTIYVSADCSKWLEARREIANAWKHTTFKLKLRLKLIAAAMTD